MRKYNQPYQVFKTCMFPNVWKVGRFEDDDNATCNYFPTSKDAEEEAKRRNNTYTSSLEEYVHDIAVEHCEGYPDIENCDTREQLWAITSTLEGTDLANKDLHFHLTRLREHMGLTALELVELLERLQNEQIHARVP